MVNFNLNQLYTFYLVVSLKSFSKAAQALSVTEPAVSIQIRGLEESLGCQLLTRVKKSFNLTEAGRLVFDYAEKIYGLVSDLNSEIKKITGDSKETLTVGTTKYLASVLFPPLLSAFLKHSPGVSIRIEEGSSMNIVDGLVQGNYEIAITGRIPYPKNLLQKVEFTSVTIYPVASPKGRLSNKVLEISDLNEEPLIVRDRYSAIRFNTITKMSDCKINPKVIIESGSTDLIKELVKQNRGYSFLPWAAISKEIEKKELVILNVNNLHLDFPVDILYLKDLKLSSVAEKFINFLMSKKKPSLEETISNLHDSDH